MILYKLSCKDKVYMNFATYFSAQTFPWKTVDELNKVLYENFNLRLVRNKGKEDYFEFVNEEELLLFILRWA